MSKKRAPTKSKCPARSTTLLDSDQFAALDRLNDELHYTDSVCSSDTIPNMCEYHVLEVLAELCLERLLAQVRSDNDEWNNAVLRNEINAMTSILRHATWVVFEEQVPLAAYVSKRNEWKEFFAKVLDDASTAVPLWLSMLTVIVYCNFRRAQ